MAQMSDQAWAKSVLAGIQKVKDKAKQDERSNPAYWNGDSWGSISGIRDAEEWVEGQVVKYLLHRIDSRAKQS